MTDGYRSKLYFMVGINMLPHVSKENLQQKLIMRSTTSYVWARLDKKERVGFLYAQNLEKLTKGFSVRASENTIAYDYRPVTTMICDWTDKKNYYTHYRNSKGLVEMVMKVRKVNKILKFEPNKWCKSFF